MIFHFHVSSLEGIARDFNMAIFCAWNFWSWSVEILLYWSRKVLLLLLLMMMMMMMFSYIRRWCNEVLNHFLSFTLPFFSIVWFRLELATFEMLQNYWVNLDMLSGVVWLLLFLVATVFWMYPRIWHTYSLYLTFLVDRLMIQDIGNLQRWQALCGWIPQIICRIMMGS